MNCVKDFLGTTGLNVHKNASSSKQVGATEIFVCKSFKVWLCNRTACQIGDCNSSSDLKNTCVWSNQPPFCLDNIWTEGVIIRIKLLCEQTSWRGVALVLPIMLSFDFKVIKMPMHCRLWCCWIFIMDKNTNIFQISHPGQDDCRYFGPRCFDTEKPPGAPNFAKCTYHAHSFHKVLYVSQTTVDKQAGIKRIASI